MILSKMDLLIGINILSGQRRYLRDLRTLKSEFTVGKQEIYQLLTKQVPLILSSL